MTPRKHCDTIKKWADGAEVQGYNPLEKEWKDIRYPMFNDEEVYRIKPESIRIALHSNSDNQIVPIMWYGNSNFDEIETYESFVRWLTEEVHYEM